jgi:hypothetical protein
MCRKVCRPAGSRRRERTLTCVTQTIRYAERLTVPWPWWPAALAVGAVLGLQVGFAAEPIPPGLSAAGLAVVPALALWWFGRLQIAVGGGEFRVDDARLPVSLVTEVVALDAEGRRLLLGPAADPLAFVVQRPWISGAVQVLLNDPQDPTPYWLVSTRHPDRLAAVLTGGGAGAAGS